MANALRWEYQRRFAPRDVVVELPYGATMVCPPWSGSMRATVCLGLDDFEEQSFVLNVLRPGDTVLDVGAHFGTYTVAMASRGATVHAFEPAPSARGVLQRNVSRNGFDTLVVVYGTALSDRIGLASFTASLDSGNHLVREASAGSVTVPVQTLDTWAERHNLASLALVKIDAEGEDERILAGGHDVLSQFQPVILVEYWQGGDLIRAAVRRLGYEIYRYDPYVRQLAPAGAARRADGNIIACPPSRADEANADLRSRPPVRIQAPRVMW
jgi:FkbM family methyltransferase